MLRLCRIDLLLIVLSLSLSAGGRSWAASTGMEVGTSFQLEATVPGGSQTGFESFTCGRKKCVLKLMKR